MRKAFTLMELIFTMVIIALAFTVLPKILQVGMKTYNKSIQEEALFSAVALMGQIKSLRWDEKNNEYDDILLVNSGNSDYECTSKNIRKGGFIGSRNCKNRVFATESLGKESDDDGGYDDIDDFNNEEINASSDYRKYKIYIKVDYVQDLDADLPSEQFKNNSASSSTNTKYVVLDINRTKDGKNIARFRYTSFNIGQLQINRRPWNP